MNPASNSRFLAPATDRLFGPARFLAPATDRVSGPARWLGPARYLGPVND